MSISTPFIERPVGTTLLTIALALAGGLAYFHLPVSPLPQVEFPTVQVSASLPGASPETMASAVATPLERHLGQIAGVTEMTSSSSLGSTGITLQFELSRDIDAAARDVQAAINAASGQLPANLPSKPSYRKVNPADSPVMILTLRSNLYDQAKLYDAASSILQQKLSQVEGIGQVYVGGASLPAVRVDVNPITLNNIGLGLADVRTALNAANANRPKGSISDERRTWSLSATDQLLEAKDYRPLVVAYRNGSPVRLSDVASVIDSVEDTRNGGLSDGKPAIVLVLSRQPGANIIETADRVREMMPQLQASIPPAMKLELAMDRTTTIRASVHDVQITLMLSIGLVILVVFVFLRDVRSTLIASVAVPISLIATFGVMYLLDYSIDNLSLMALTVATGFVVDDAIVVIENITRYLEQGMSPRDAALRGAREIGFTVVSISVSLVAVFIPILLMQGIVGRLFREFAVTLSVAIGVSMIVSLTTTPMMGAALLRAHDPNRHNVLYRASEWVFNAILRFYEITLAWVLRRQFLMILLTLATVALTIHLYVIIPKGFFPQQDTGRLMGNIIADQDTSSRTMRRLLAQFAQVASEDPASDTVIAFTGGGGRGGGSVNSGRMFIALKDSSERKLTADEVIGRLRPKLMRIPGATLYLQSIQDLRIGGRASSTQYQYSLQADNLKDLTEWTPKLTTKVQTLPGVVDVVSDQMNRGLQAQLEIDRATASRLGITSKMIDDALYDAFGQRQVSTMYTELNQYRVVMEVDDRFAEGPESLKHLYIRPTDGPPVPLSAIARYVPSSTPLAVNHQGQFPCSTISFNLRPGTSLSDVVSQIEEAGRDIGMPTTIRGSFAGTAQAFQNSVSSQPMLILAALVAVYIVLGILYESFIHPITILSTLPSAGVGALVALILFDVELSVIAIIGIILLIGIVKKNAILMIDFALDAERREGKPTRQAIFEACMLRFRPIIMTTMAALLGGLPLAVAGGVGAEFRRPLGIAIVGGLIFSQALTLYTTPVIYLYMDRLRLWSRRLFHADEHRLPDLPPPLAEI